jgi:primosomal protein N' (replication factor Y) (superfamily II helicase)
MYADIIVDISHEQLDRTFQYAVPEKMEQDIDVGVLVNVPFGRGNRTITGYVIELSNEPKLDIDKIKYIDSIVPDKVKAVSRMIKLAAWLKHNYGSTMNQALKTVIPVKEKVKHKEKKSVRLVIDRHEAQSYIELFVKKNAKARLRLLQALMQEQVIDCAIVKEKLNITMQTVNTLVKLGIADIEVENIYRNPIKNTDDSEKRLTLNPEQKHVVDTFIKDYDNGNRHTYLIHGVTGSGKTLCYLDMIEHVVSHKKQVIMLIPEIALTFQTVQRFYRRFGDRVSIINSRMSKGERYDQFLRAMRGEIDIMIGPRSALFTPFSDIGLIVIDEEHESAYNSEQSPRYHAKETAIYIAKEHNASVILGSATPSVETYYHALTGEYKLFTLSRRALGNELPKVYVEDLREELKSGNRSILSRRLKALIEDRLNNNKQVMLFLNKRGYAGFISCRSCGHVMKCPHCDISLTFHKNGKLVCHYCGYEQPSVNLCPKCGSRYISGFRAGTQQVEEVIKKMYPAARTLRMDMDTTTGKEGHEKILSAFANHEADILIGTQMIVKGHDFPDVTLVGVLAADMSLYSGSYMAAERTFQLLTQAAGRAGRGDTPGEVVIQTYTPDNYSIKTAQAQDYNAFYEEEIAYRRLMEYPPISNMLKVSIASKNEKILDAAADYIKNNHNRFHGNEINVYDPVNAGIYKINDIYTKLIYAKAQDYEALTDFKDKIEDISKNADIFKNVNTQFEFN